jgi:uncharacterized protein (DUF2147 family)
MKPLLFLASFLAAAPALADPIEGNWRTPRNETVAIRACGGNWCATLVGGQYAGAAIGIFSGADGSYSGRMTEPKDGRSGNATATVEGATMRIRGCVTKLVCLTRQWTRL